MLEQQMASLTLANAVRKRRADLKARAAGGDLDLAGLLEEADVQRVPIFDLLQWLPGYGRERSRRVLRAVNVSETLEVRALSPRRRAALVTAVGPTPPRVVSHFYS